MANFIELLIEALTINGAKSKSRSFVITDPGELKVVLNEAAGITFGLSFTCNIDHGSKRIGSITATDSKSATFKQDISREDLDDNGGWFTVTIVNNRSAKAPTTIYCSVSNNTKTVTIDMSRDFPKDVLQGSEIYADKGEDESYFRLMGNVRDISFNAYEEFTIPFIEGMIAGIEYYRVEINKIRSTSPEFLWMPPSNIVLFPNGYVAIRFEFEDRDFEVVGTDRLNLDEMVLYIFIGLKIVDGRVRFDNNDIRVVFDAEFKTPKAALAQLFGRVKDKVENKIRPKVLKHLGDINDTFFAYWIIFHAEHGIVGDDEVTKVEVLPDSKIRLEYISR